MLGNAWEWSHEVSRYPSVSLTGEPVEDLPDTSVVTNSLSRGLRGGSFMSQPEDTRSAHRFRYQPAFRNYSVGMRAARTLTEK